MRYDNNIIALRIILGETAPNAVLYDGGDRPQRGLLRAIVKVIEKAIAGYWEAIVKVIEKAIAGYWEAI